MRWLLMVLGLIIWAGCSSTTRTSQDTDPASRSRILKVLPHLVDQEGRHTVLPSLYERDAYQEHLRQNPELQRGLRFDVHWKAPSAAALVMKVEIRGIQEKNITLASLVAPALEHSGGREWSSVTIDGTEYQQFGSLQAWRATLWSGSLLLAEQKSFLW